MPHFSFVSKHLRLPRTHGSGEYLRRVLKTFLSFLVSNRVCLSFSKYWNRPGLSPKCITRSISVRLFHHCVIFIFVLLKTKNKNTFYLASDMHDSFTPVAKRSCFNFYDDCAHFTGFVQEMIFASVALTVIEWCLICSCNRQRRFTTNIVCVR